ncbi:MAG: helix-hairpin-helix domain-containing protein [Prevotellaceae bacterium]|jgi:DNA uptake protein ComE-like DNA-binding protein|nr:helix-hairpin-helix domain-containing protein [Prevotellaceae bacterium]
MPWKDYFYFSRSQRRGLIVLLALVVILFVADGYIYYKKTRHDFVRNPVFVDSVSRFQALLQEDSPRWQQRNYPERKKDFYPKYSNGEEKETPKLFAFDPNTLDSAGFVQLGLKPFVARNIMKFRKAGGKFRRNVDFAKLYGLQPEQFEQLKPYLHIENQEEETPQITQSLIIELNAADTLALLQVRGMYASLAKRIVGYRKRLGGYHNINQLLEIKGIKPEKIQQLSPFLTIDKEQIRKINLNRASIDRMRNHPYFNFYQAKAIYEYRRNKGKIESFDELKNIDSEDITSLFLEKIHAYVEF